ncbi:MAG: cyclase family protein [Methanobacterium sp.]|jgi:kynurenine formamidase|nr:cyclase family protein [Methanobacterium sp.]
MNPKKNISNRCKYIRLSYTLNSNSPLHPDLKEPRITPKNQILTGGNYNTSIITVENHSGTHVDAPAHFLKDGKIISDYSADELVFYNSIIWDCPKNRDELINKQDISHFLSKNKVLIKNIDCLLLRTGFGTYHDENAKIYSTQNPGISPGAVFYLRCQLPNLACLGIDTISMSRYGRMKESIEVHQNAFMNVASLGKPLVLVEDLDLRVVGEGTELIKVLVVPWQVDAIDSAPCTVLAQIN